MGAMSMLPILFHFCISENTIFLVSENIFHSSLYGTMILYTILACFVTQTKIRQTIRKWDLFLHIAPLLDKEQLFFSYPKPTQTTPNIHA